MSTIRLKNTRSLYIVIGIAIASLAILLIGLASGSQKAQTPAGDSSTVTELGATQYIEITAKSGGYYPTVISAKPNMKTIIRFVTNKSYGCETAMTIPSLGISKNLPPTGFTEVEIGKGEQGKDLLVTCLMRMYSATIRFS